MATIEQAVSTAQQLVAVGRLEEAESVCRQWLQGKPQHAELLALLGQLECRKGAYDESIRCFRAAIATQPEDALLHRNLGVVFSAAGRLDEAINSYLRSLELKPDSAESLNDLGVAYKRTERFDLAVESFQAALRFGPQMILPRRHLADVLLLQNKPDDAIMHLEELVRLNPMEAEVRNTLGNALAAKGAAEGALAQYREALRLRPDFAEAELNLASVLQFAGKHDEAVAHCRKALLLRPEVPEVHNSLGNAVRAQGNTDAAIQHLHDALELRPSYADAHNSLGSICTDLGKFAEAVNHLEDALRADPRCVAAYHNLGDLAYQDKYLFSSEQIARVKALLDGDGIVDEDICLLFFTLGRAYDKQGNYGDAFQAFRRANETKQRFWQAAGHAFDVAAHHRFIDNMIGTFDSAFWHEKCIGVQESQVPVFIVGMPRSGTTLVEQIVSSHPDAVGGGELPDIAQLADGLASRLRSDQTYPMSVVEIDDPTICSMAQHYLQRLTDLGDGARRVVDKMWSNFLHLGLIAAMLPNARVIHCQRNPMDVGLSCYLSNFNSIPWACRQEDIGFYYGEYKRLMAHWRKVLPLRMLEVSYEKLVGNQEAASRELISFCGLDWSDLCLEFYNSRQTVRTASRVQVRRPIYNTSIGRWKRYETHLSALRQVLEGLDGTDS